MSVKNRLRLFGRKFTSVVMATALTGSIVLGTTAQAAVVNPSSAAKISFTFDDSLASQVTYAAPTLAKYGYSGTDYVLTGCVGMTSVPNTCRANEDTPYMTWDQIAQLKNTYGWEIGSHTVDHYCLASTGDGTDCQTNQLTPAQVTYELTQSKADLAAHGYNATDFATPYGDYNNSVLAQIAKLYASQRGFADIGYNSWPNSDYYIKEQQVQGGASVNTVEGYINSAIQNNQWLVLVLHNVLPKASNKADDYEFSTTNLDKIAAYIKSKNVPVVNVVNGLVTSDVNLLSNSSFNNGLADGWTTDAPSNITADASNNGSWPDPTNSIKFVGGTTKSHLFSPKVSIDPGTTYMLKNFLNVAQNSSGEVGFYIDEYNSNGNWISGQYKATERSSFVEEMNFSYKPSSANVAKASLQVGLTANSGIVAYLDNSQWFPLSTVSLPPPTSTNLMPNNTFDAGISSGWSTNDPTHITADNANNGSPANPVNSVKLVSTTVNKGLFSPKIAVDSTKQYDITSYLNLKQISSGVVGFYIDEYDANGNWISGQYKTDRSAPMQGDVNFGYQPSSINVKQASLQIIVVGNSGTLAYIDNIRWLAP